MRQRDRRPSLALVAAFFGAIVVALPAHAERQPAMLDGYPLLSQRDPANYRDDSLMAAEDSAPTESGRAAVADLACLAAVYAMIERGRGNTSAMIDDFYPDPRQDVDGATDGPPRPDYVSGDQPVDVAAIEAELRQGHPVIVRGKSAEVFQHFVLVIGLRQAAEGGWRLVAYDPWPGRGNSGPAREIEIDPDAQALTSVSGLAVTFDRMRLVTGFASPLVTADASSTSGTTGASPPVVPGGDIVALKDGTVLVGTIAPATLAFQTTFGDAQVSTDKIVAYRDGTLTLADGSMLKGSFAEPMLGAAELQIATAAGRLSVPLTEVVSIRRAGASAAATAHQPSQTTALPGPGQGLLTGKVLDNFGNPIAGVLIKNHNSQFTGTTAADGTYSLPYVPGKLLLGYHHADHYFLKLSLDIATAATYPIDDMVMFRRAPTAGLFALTELDYMPLARCSIDFSEKERANKEFAEGSFSWRKWNSGVPYSLYVRGIPTAVVAVDESVP
jgi:hypothetical protein